MSVQINGSDGRIISTHADHSGNVSIGGTLTYEDVTNVDSVGLITARQGIKIGSGVGVAASISVDGNAEFAGIVTATSFSGDGSALTGIAATDNVRTGILDVAGVSTFRSNIFQTGGRIVRGSTSTIQDGDAIAGGVNITGTDMDASVIMSVFGNDGDFNRISGAKSRNATIGSHTVVNDGDTLLSLKGFGSDGTDFEEAAQIEIQVDGSPGDNDMPGRIVFKTTADGASSPTERMRISSDGYVTKPNTPSFSAHTTATRSADAEAVFDVVVTNIGNHYNTSNGRFTAPVAGNYYFSFHGMGPHATSQNGRCYFMINGSSHPSGQHYGGVAYSGGHSGGYNHISMDTILPLSANDTVSVYWQYMNLHSEHCKFNGFLIG